MGAPRRPRQAGRGRADPFAVVRASSATVHARNVRAAAAAAGLELAEVTVVDAAAAVAGAELWCAATGRSSMSTAVGWAGVPDGLSAWGVRVLMRSAGVPAVEADPPLEAHDPPGRVQQALLMAAARATDGVEQVCPELASAVWEAVACDAGVADDCAMWARQVALVYADGV